MNKEVMKQALDALKIVWEEEEEISAKAHQVVFKAIKSLEEALKQEQDEPVAWEYEEYRHAITGAMEWFPEVAFVQPPNEPTLFRKIKPLYTTPQTKEWVGLTDEQIVDLVIKNAGFPTKLAKAIEAKLRGQE